MFEVSTLLDEKFPSREICTAYVHAKQTVRAMLARSSLLRQTPSYVLFAVLHACPGVFRVCFAGCG